MEFSHGFIAGTTVTDLLLTEGVGESLNLSSFHRDGVRLFLLYCSQKSSVEDVEADNDNIESAEDFEEVEESVEKNDWSMEAEDDTSKSVGILEEVKESVDENDRSISELWSN